jgi:hypothetical protein
VSASKRFCALLVSALCFGTLSATTGATRAADEDRGGRVLPASAKPYGYSLDDMAQLMALFDTSGNSMQYYPTTPFQILFLPGFASVFSTSTCSDGKPGSITTGAQTFPVIAGTALFVPLFFFDDSPPVVGTWPTEKSMFASYIFGPADFNAQGMEIIVDGRVRALGAEFLGGPALQTSPPLLDGGGSHLVQLGVFLTPLSVGTHTVTIKGEAGDSAAFTQAILSAGSTIGDCLKQDITYTVKVFPPFEE